MAKALRILQLAPRFPFPADDGGKIGIANIFREFSNQGNEVTLFSYPDRKISQEGIEEAKKYGEVIIYEHSTENTKLKIAGSVLTHRPLFITKHISSGIKKKIAELVKSKEFDVIHADHSSMAPLGLFAKELIDKPLGLRLHNIEWMIWQRYADNLPKFHPKRMYIQSQANLLKKAEIDFYSKMDVCFAITDKDKQTALEMAPKANVVVASAGVNPEEWLPDDNLERNPNELVLATVWNWVHNYDGAVWFINEVLPIVKGKIPSIQLSLIGKHAPYNLHSPEKGVNVIGYVDSVRQYLNKANIYVAPLFVGSGIRIKILEAMAMKLPVVATKVSAEGIGATEKEGLFITDNPEEYANYIIDLCANFGDTRCLGNNAREFVINNYSWQKNVGIMIDEYWKLV